MTNLVQFLVNFSLDIWMVQQEEESPHETWRGCLHASKEKVNHVIEECKVTWD